MGDIDKKLASRQLLRGILKGVKKQTYEKPTFNLLLPSAKQKIKKWEKTGAKKQEYQYCAHTKEGPMKFGEEYLYSAVFRPQDSTPLVYDTVSPEDLEKEEHKYEFVCRMLVRATEFMESVAKVTNNIAIIMPYVVQIFEILRSSGETRVNPSVFLNGTNVTSGSILIKGSVWTPRGTEVDWSSVSRAVKLYLRNKIEQETDFPVDTLEYNLLHGNAAITELFRVYSGQNEKLANVFEGTYFPALISSLEVSKSEKRQQISKRRRVSTGQGPSTNTPSGEEKASSGGGEAEGMDEWYDTVPYYPSQEFPKVQAPPPPHLVPATFAYESAKKRRKSPQLHGKSRQLHGKSRQVHGKSRQVHRKSRSLHGKSRQLHDFEG